MKTERFPMPLKMLKEGIKFGMKENMRIQFVLPCYPLPKNYWETMMSIDHSIIAPGNIDYNGLVPQNTLYQMPDVLIFEDVNAFADHAKEKNLSYVLKIDKNTLYEQIDKISACIQEITRLNIILNDIDRFTNDDIDKYKECLNILSNGVKRSYFEGNTPQVNIVTDRIMLKEMNNCNAGVSSVTLAPDGKFYICPAFYQAVSSTPIRTNFDIGSLYDGINIKNSNLLKLESAPLCRKCDAYQCKRCIWLNNKTTYEMNTPSHEQCVVAHLERNASCIILKQLRKGAPSFMEGIIINDIDYLDPFEVKQEK